MGAGLELEATKGQSRGWGEDAGGASISQKVFLAPQVSRGEWAFTHRKHWAGTGRT